MFCIQPGCWRSSRGHFLKEVNLNKLGLSPPDDTLSIGLLPGGWVRLFGGIGSCLESLLLPVRGIIQDDRDESKQKDS